MGYKIVDGQLCKVEVVDANEAQHIVDAVLSQAQPLIDGIASCDAQIKKCQEQKALYKSEICNLTASLDKELFKTVSPDKATLLGF